MINLRSLGVLLAGGLWLGGCATAIETRPYRTATEQLLVSHAADKAAASLVTSIKPGTAVYLNTVNFRGEGSDYAASAIRQALLKQGAKLARDQADSEVVVEVRLGALSIDQMQRVLGVPALTLPNASNYTTFTIPELSVYSRSDRTGVAEFSAFAYDARTGAPIAVAGRMVGKTQIRSHKLFMVMSWGQQEVRPGDRELDAEPWWKPW